MKYFKELIMGFFLLGVVGAAFANAVTDQLTQTLNQKDTQVAQPNKDDSLDSSKSISKKFQAINQNYALVLFYRSSCPHCQRFDPIVKSFAAHYGFTVYPYTTDGQSLPSFPNSMPATQEIVNVFFGSPSFMVPSLFLINVQTLEAYPVSQGEMSYEDLLSQMLNLQNILIATGSQS